MFRFILVVLFLILYFILTIPVLGFLFILGKINITARHKVSLAIVQRAFKMILFITGTRITVKGYENIPKDQAVLYVGNHRSYFDILIVYSMVPGLTGFVAKKEMEKIPFLSTWMKLVNCLFLDRENIKEGLKTILTGIEHIKSGISICIFPEGTRNKQDGEMLPFKEGSLKMAEKTGCPIIPIGLNRTSTIFEDHFPRIKKTKVTVEFGKPIHQEELSREDRKFLGAYTQNIIREIVKSNQS